MNITELGKRCCGCGACAALCPVGCIAMEPDGEGFLTPHVNAGACLDCGLCLQRCPVMQAKPDEHPAVPVTYAAHALDADVLPCSSSGGVFTVLALDTLQRGGRVYGAVMETPGDVEIVGTDDPAGIAAMRRSKYVQGRVDAAVYAEVKQTLEANRPVLFTGCPCHTAAVRAYVGKEYENLLTAEIVCHGVPSPLLFKTYLKTLAQRDGKAVSAYTFRDKSKGWGMFYRYEIGSRSVCKRSAFDPFMNNFMRGAIYRESCYQCAFARQDRSADLTLGDFWGVLKEYPELYDPRGRSAVLVNTPKGEKAFERVRAQLEAREVEYRRVARHNENMYRPSPRPSARDDTYKGLGELPPKAFVHKRLRVRNAPRDTVKALLPAALKKLYKKLFKEG